MKTLRITVNGTPYDVQVEEVSGGAAPAGPAAAPAPQAAPPPHTPAPAAPALEAWPPNKGNLVLVGAGFLPFHPRQLDMIMQDTAQVAARREEMLAHCRDLFTGRTLPATDAQEAPPCR